VHAHGDEILIDVATEAMHMTLACTARTYTRGSAIDFYRTSGIMIRLGSIYPVFRISCSRARTRPELEVHVNVRAYAHP
jgi:hypothetical protein